VRDSYEAHLITDLPYGANVEEKLDLFLPATPVNPEKIPLLMFAHGGYWQQLSKKRSQFSGHRLDSNGLRFCKY